ncbi:Xanthine dehydrogenase [Handroanthus impetiginosus]|uniref:Xanthine dehydrogenase n=1 Tax=Handroanthus impetiginosus TaxID=429701 RepID=A0A2G9GWJ1_9LAMI|nr:Xanthine dehydrogenase [Handroanthus impetiginosus]
MGSLMTENEMERIEETESKEPIVYVNGVRRILPDGLAHLTLLEYLRGKSYYDKTSSRTFL